MKNIKEIWKSFVEGQDVSFRELIFVHYESLYNYGNRFTNDAELIKDAIQDLFLILWNKKGSISQPENIKAYLFSSLRRLIHRKIKSNERTQKGSDQLDYAFNFQVSIELQYIKDESALTVTRRIAQALEKLPPRQKEVVFLKFYQGFDRNEIAQAMDISPQTVSNLLQIALSKLKNDLGGSFDPTILYFVIPLLLKEIF